MPRNCGVEYEGGRASLRIFEGFNVASTRKTSKAVVFMEDMIRCRGIEFARLGMMVEIDGDMGTIEGMNSSANLSVRFTNQLKFSKRLHNCHPTWNVKYFDEAGAVIAHFTDGVCMLRPERSVA